MANKVKADVRINDSFSDEEDSITLLLTESQAVDALRVIVAGESLKLTLALPSSNGYRSAENPAAYAQ